MPMLFIGVLLLAAKMAEIGPTADLSWWWVLAPFAAATLWWAFADSTGITQRRAMDKMEARKVKRREDAMEALGLNPKRHPPSARNKTIEGQATRRDDAGGKGPGQ
jgi:small Trp-rich protein